MGNLAVRNRGIATILKEETLITAIVTSNAILVSILTALFIREWSRRRALEEVLRQSIDLWRNANEANLDGRNFDSGRTDDDHRRVSN